jgi:hypothetical protein
MNLKALATANCNCMSCVGHSSAFSGSLRRFISAVRAARETLRLCNVGKAGTGGTAPKRTDRSEDLRRADQT